MKHLHLLIPDLFPPQEIAADVCAGLRLPALEILLGRGNSSTSPVAFLEDWLCAEFGAQSVAPVRAASDGLDVGEAYWLCADPVNLQMQHARMLVLPDVIPSPQEASALCGSLNEHFAGTGMFFFAPHPQRWYIRLEEEPQITTSALQQVAWCDAKFRQPQGTDALRWQRIVTEVQMLLYAHPLNQGREARGEPLINSLWFWGGGRPSPLKKPFDAVGGDSQLSAAFAQAAQVPWIDSMQAMLDEQYENGLWVCDLPRAALQRGDAYAWRLEVERVEREYAVQLLKALQSGRLHRLTLEVLRAERARKFDFTRGDTWKLWRSVRPLARYAV